MTHPRTARHLLPIVAALGAIAAALLVPASAGATLMGMESTWQLVNTNQTDAQREAALDKMKEQGVQVVRANWRWYEVAAGCGGQTAAALENPDNACYDWSRLDNLVTAANARKLQVLLSIQQNPKWANGSDNVYYMGGTTAQFNSVATYFASFYAAVADRYDGTHGHGTIKYFTVHNEPNSAMYWGAKPDAKRYAKLYGMTAVKIKAANPGALIAAGPTGPTGGNGGMKPKLFIQQFQQAIGTYLPGGSPAAKRKYINAWAHNPYPDAKNGPTYFSRTQDANSISMGTLDKLFTQLDMSPITKGAKVWATEFGWQTMPEKTLKVTFDQQAQFIAETFDYLSSKPAARVQIGVNYGLADPDGAVDWQSGTMSNSLKPKKSFAMYQRMISVPAAGTAGTVKPGTKLRVWGRSNVNPSGTQIAYRIIGAKCDPKGTVSGFCVIKGQRTVAGTPGAKFGYVTTAKGQRLEFSTYDTVAKAYGPIRSVVVR